MSDFWNSPSALSASMVGKLSTRGEKRIVPIGNPKVGENEANEEHLSYAKRTLTDFITIRIPSRDFTYRFLINPKSVQVNHQTLDSQAMTRAGWQLGVWGEDTIDLQIQGTTAGQYFSTIAQSDAAEVEGLTDRYGEYSLSYRNLLELVNLFENNGYYFEGEAADDKAVSPNYKRKRIKCHGDVEIRVGNFIWTGMFANMNVNDTADSPYFMTFDFNFLAWKERFADDSPWRNSIRNSRSRGHDALLGPPPIVTPLTIPPKTFNPVSMSDVDPLFTFDPSSIQLTTSLPNLLGMPSADKP